MKKVLLGLVITIILTNNGYTKNFQQRTNQELIVIFEVSYTEDFEIIEKYLIDESGKLVKRFRSITKPDSDKIISLI